MDAGFDQQQLLREIRDELRATRSESMGAPEGLPLSALSRPNNAFIRSQLQVDRALHQTWAGLGWAAAYRSEIQGGLFSDAFAMTGLGQPPNTMFGWENQALTGERMAMRGASIVSDLLLPVSSRQRRDFGNDILRQSGRFMRAGNPGVGFMGTGFSSGAAQQISRDLHSAAVSDLLLSEADYRSIGRIGMATGQFDLETGAEGFKSRTKEMADAVGELTRVLRMSVKDVAEGMGSLRHAGVVNIQEQRNILAGIGATARVSGISSEEAASAAFGAIQAGMPMGMRAGTSAALSGANVAVIRSLAQMGVISPELAAAGGGTLAIAQSITQAQQAFASSMPGYLMMRGGGGAGGDSINAMMRGLDGATSFHGMLRLQAGQMEFMQGQSASDVQQAHAGMLQTRLKMMGISDFQSQEAQDAVFAMTRGSMGEAGALSFAKSNFSAEGAAEARRAQFRVAQDARQRQRMMDAERYELEHGTAFYAVGRRTARRIAGVAEGMYNNVVDAVSAGQRGSWFAPGALELNARALASGGVADLVSDDALIDEMARVMGTRGGGAPAQIQLRPGARSFEELSIGERAIVQGSATVGLVGGGIAGLVSGSLMGTPIGGAVLAVGGGAAGYHAGHAYGMEKVHSSWAAANGFSLAGDDAITLSGVQRGLGNAEVERGRGLILGTTQTRSGSTLFASAAFRELRDQAYTSKGISWDNKASSQGNLALFRRAMQETGESAEAIAGAIRAGGGGIVNPDQLTAPASARQAAVTAVGAAIRGTSLENATANLMTSEAMGGMADLAKAVQGNDNELMAKAAARLGNAGVNVQLGGKDADTELLGKLRGLSSDFIEQLRQGEKSGISQAALFRMQDFQSVVLGDAGLAGDQTLTGKDAGVFLADLLQGTGDSSKVREGLGKSRSAVGRYLNTTLGLTDQQLVTLAAGDAKDVINLFGVDKAQARNMARQFKRKGEDGLTREEGASVALNAGFEGQSIASMAQSKRVETVLKQASDTLLQAVTVIERVAK